MKRAPKTIANLAWSLLFLVIVAQILIAVLAPYFGFIQIVLIAVSILAVIYFIGKRANAIRNR
jgi:hypothetical protein